MAKYFTNIPLQPENLRSLRDAIIKNVLEDENIREVLTIDRVRSGEPLAVIGEMDAVGNASTGCCPQYKQIGIGNSVKRWDLGEWQIPLEICYKDLEGTIAEYALKAGTEIGNLEGTDFLAIYLDLLSKQMRRMIWRLAWFGDKTADTVANGGQLVNGTDKTLFTVNDGLFKRINAGVAGGTIENVTTTGMTSVMQVVEALLDGAPATINQNGEGLLIMPRSRARQLARDVRTAYNEIMPWEQVFEGVEVTRFDGVKVASVAAFDYLNSTYQPTVSLPIIYTVAKNLHLGTDADEPVSELDIWFDKDCRKQKVYASGRIDTLIGEDGNIAVASVPAGV